MRRSGGAYPYVLFERFTPEGRQVVVLAQEEARTLKHGHVAAEHILLGLMREEHGVASRVLKSLHLSVEGVRAEVAGLAGSTGQAFAGQIPFDSSGKEVLEVALREALGLGHNYVGTEHLLLALARVDSAATRIMDEHGADGATIRREVTAIIASNASAQTSLPVGEGIPYLVGIATTVARAEGRDTIELPDILVAVTRMEQTRKVLARLGIDEATMRDSIARAAGPDDRAIED